MLLRQIAVVTFVFVRSIPQRLEASLIAAVGVALYAVAVWRYLVLYRRRGSQLLLAIPAWILFEIGILFGRLVEGTDFVAAAIKLMKEGLGDKTPLIGFAGAPFTLASYAIEGGGSKNYYEAKKLMLGDEGLWNAFMSKLSSAIADYLIAQIDAGAQAVQLFDSWIGCLSPADYRRYVLPHTKAIFDKLPKGTPAIHFGTGNPELYPAMKEAGGDVIGIDWRMKVLRSTGHRHMAVVN